MTIMTDELALELILEMAREGAVDQSDIDKATTLAEARSAWGTLIDVLASAAEVRTGAKKAALMLQLARLYRDKVGFLEAAMDWYEAALLETPDDEDALEEYSGMCQEENQLERLADTLLNLASMRPGDATQLRLLAGDLRAENSSPPLLVAEAWLDALSHDPDAHEAFERLEQLYAEHEIWDHLIRTYEQKLDEIDDNEIRVDLLQKLALLAESALDDADLAHQYHHRLLELQPDNVRTLDDLARHYADRGDHEQHLDILMRQVEAADTIGDKVTRLEEIGRIIQDQTGDRERLVTIEEEILELDPGNAAAIERLTAMFTDAEDWDGAINLLERRLELASDDDTRVALLLAAGDLCSNSLNDIERARGYCNIALELLPGDGKVKNRLISLYEESEDWDGLLKFFLGLAKEAADEEARAHLFVEMAQVTRHHKQDVDAAIRLYEAALERVPNLLSAVTPLSEIYFAREDWAKAFLLLEMERQLKEGEVPPKELATIYSHMGLANRRMGKRKEALDYYRTAYDKDSSSVETLLALAQMNEEIDSFDIAKTYYHRLLETFSEETDSTLTATAYQALGRMEARQGDPQAAYELLNKALVLIPDDTGIMTDLACLLQARGRIEESVSFRRRVLDTLSDPLQKLQALVAIAETWLEQDDGRHKAIAAYTEVLAIDPTSRAALVKLLEIHITDENFEEAVAILQRLIDTTEETTRKASYCFTLATLLLAELNDSTRAAQQFEITLDYNPEKLDALKTLVSLHTEAEDFEALEGVYLRMLARLSNAPNQSLEQVLYKGLGDLYVHHLGQPEEATQAFEEAGKRKADDAEVHSALANLYGQSGRLEEALVELRALIALGPDQEAPYRQMATILNNLDRPDDATFCQAALAVRNPEASLPPRPAGYISAQQSVTREQWTTALFSKAEDTRVGKIFILIDRAIGSELNSRSLKDLGLRRRDRIDPRSNDSLSRILRDVSQLLDVELPDIYRKQGQQGMCFEGTRPPVLVVGDDIGSTANELETAFAIGKNLTYALAEHSMAAGFERTVLKHIYTAAVRMFYPAGIENTSDENLMALALRLNKKLSADDQDVLGELLEFYASRQRQASVSRWLTSIELTANHAGLLACMDLTAAIMALQNDPFMKSSLPKRDQAEELILYAIGEEFATLREQLNRSLSE